MRPLLELGSDNLGLVTGSSILQEVCCPMLHHEKLQLLIQDPAIPHSIHHLPLLEELQTGPAQPAEGAPGHDLGGKLDSLASELGVKAVRANRSPAQPPGVGKSELKMALIAKHDLLPVLNAPSPITLSEGQPLVLHGLGDEGLGCHLPGGQLQLLQTHPLDGPDACVGQGRHESLQLASSEGGVPNQMPPHDNEEGGHHLGWPPRCLLPLGHRVLWRCLSSSQDTPQGPLIHLELLPDVLQRHLGLPELNSSSLGVLRKVRSFCFHCQL